MTFCFCPLFVPTRSFRRADAQAKFRRHAKDCGSPEVQISLLTARIEELSQHLQKHKKVSHGELAERKFGVYGENCALNLWGFHCKMAYACGLRISQGVEDLSFHISFLVVFTSSSRSTRPSGLLVSARSQHDHQQADGSFAVSGVDRPLVLHPRVHRAG